MIRISVKRLHYHSKAYLNVPKCFCSAKSQSEPRKKELSNTTKLFIDVATLSKARLSGLVAFTTAAGFFCAGGPMDLSSLAITCLGTGLCAGSASSFNQIFEKERDAQMKRTSNRPLPTERISKDSALIFGTSTGMLGSGLLLFGTNPVVAALGLGNILLYAGPYTFSKRYTEWNTWIGSLVGAIPPVMGYAAATGGVILAPEPIILSSILFLWQFPHFFALSWMHRIDYARGGFQMVACNDITGTRTANLIQEYTIYLTILPLLTSAIGYTSYMFALEGTLINIYLLTLVHKFKKDRSNNNARNIFLCSLWYVQLSYSILLLLLIYMSLYSYASLYIYSASYRTSYINRYLPVLLCGYVFFAKETKQVNTTSILQLGNGEERDEEEVRLLLI